MATISGQEFFGGKPPAAPVAAAPSPLDGFGLIDRIGGDFQQRKAAADEAKMKGKTGQQSPASSVLQIAGEGAGFISDLGMEALKSLDNVFTGGKVGELASSYLQKVASTPENQQRIKKLKGWAEAHPEAAANLGAFVDIASIVPTSAAATVGVKGAMKGAELGAKGAAAGAREAADLTGQALQATGQKIQQTVIKPSQRDLADGFNIENVGKYDLGGTLPQTVAKTHTKLNELSQQLTEKLKGANVGLNLNDTYAETAKRLTAGKSRAFGDNAAIARVLENLKSEVDTVAGPNGMVDLVEATNVKRGAGNKGAWSFNRPEPDASAIEKVYNEFYDVLKGQIEIAAPEGIRDINKQLSELIPIQNAALRRLPVEQRNQAISLTDSIGLFSAVFDPRALLILGATKASKSGRVGNVLEKTGAKLRTK